MEKGKKDRFQGVNTTKTAHNFATGEGVHFGKATSRRKETTECLPNNSDDKDAAIAQYLLREREAKHAIGSHSSQAENRLGS